MAIRDLGRIVGDSAYESAIKLGMFVGSEADWIASLKGETGYSMTNMYIDSNKHFIVETDDPLRPKIDAGQIPIAATFGSMSDAFEVVGDELHLNYETENIDFTAF